MAEFLPAIEYVLGNEGGYVNDEDDPGGETNWGICKRDHLNVDIKNLTKECAEEIYRTQYWDYDQIQDQRVATKLLDMAVNMEGTGAAGAAIRIFQMAIYKQTTAVFVDGVFGPRTTVCANKCNPDLLLIDMTAFAIEHYKHLVDRNPKLEKFLKGWKLRACKLPKVIPWQASAASSKV